MFGIVRPFVNIYSFVSQLIIGRTSKMYELWDQIEYVTTALVLLEYKRR